MDAQQLKANKFLRLIKGKCACEVLAAASSTVHLITMMNMKRHAGTQLND